MFKVLSRMAEGLSDDEAIKRTADDLFAAAHGAGEDAGLPESTGREFLKALRRRLEEAGFDE